jgi:tetratricopeptide (TPR) repeat protein
MARAARVARVARPRAPTRVARGRRVRARAAPREDADARIDLRASVEDRVKKAREYAAAMERARAEGDGGDRDDAMEASTTDGTLAGETASDGATGATRKREVTVRILTRDRDYDPFDADEKAVGYDVEDAVYKPSVSTWGVFERPPDISKTYGGGRTVKREELEDEEAIAARRARVAKKLAKYREDQGMTLTNAEYAEVREVLERSGEAMKRGYMQDALDLLEPWALDRIGQKTEMGGRIIFNYAICLDNLQRRDEALKQYRRCIGNQYGNVSKQADRMIWGMTTASKKMKSDLFDYMDAAKLDAYDEYLIKMANEKFAGEIDEEEVKALNTQAMLTMVGLFGAPMLLFAYLTTSTH